MRYKHATKLQHKETDGQKETSPQLSFFFHLDSQYNIIKIENAMDININGNPGTGNTFTEIHVQHAGSVNPNAQTVNNNYGMSCDEVLRLVHELLKPELALCKQEAEKKVLERVEVMNNKLLERLMQVEAVVRQRFQEPAIQFAVHETMTEYILSGKEELSDDLIDLMIERLQVEEYSTKQALIDDVRHILPKLPASAAAILAMLAFVKIIETRPRTQFIDCLKKLSPLLGQLRDLRSLDVAYLEQVRCGQTLTVVMANGSFINMMKDSYDVFFTHPITYETYNRILVENRLITDVDTKNREVAMLLFAPREGGLLQYNLSTKADNRVLDGPHKDYLIACFEAIKPHLKPYTDDEIRQFFLDIDPNWQYVFDLFERRDIQSFRASPVGIYIGTRKLTRLLGEEIPIGMFYADKP